MIEALNGLGLRTASLVLGAGTLALIATGVAAETYRLAATSQPGAEDILDAERFANEVRERTDGRVDIQIYPSSQLGDYVQVFESMSRGGIDMAMQAIPSSVDQRMSLLTFPMAIEGYDSAKQAFAPGGYMFDLVDSVVTEHDVKLIGSWGRGMAGGAFAGPVENPKDPNAEHDQKVRVWPGGNTHYALMERLGYNPATVPWAELYTAMQTGVVDGYVGSSSTSAVDNFLDVVETWVDFQDHFTMAFFIMNQDAWNELTPEDQQVLIDVAGKISQERFDTVEKADQAALDKLAANGAEIVTFSPEERAAMIEVVRADVWPELKDEIGEDLFNDLVQATGTGSTN